MGLFSLDVAVSGDTEASALLATLLAATENLEPALDEITADFEQLESRRFAAEGPGWAPLTEPYASHKGGGSILVRSGQMRDDVLSAEVEQGPLSLTLSTTATPFVFHQYGTVKMVQRQIVDVQDGDVQRWVGLVVEYLSASIE